MRQSPSNHDVPTDSLEALKRNFAFLAPLAPTALRILSDKEPAAEVHCYILHCILTSPSPVRWQAGCDSLDSGKQGAHSGAATPSQSRRSVNQ